MEKMLKKTKVLEGMPPRGGDGIEVCCFDNYDDVRSSVPPNKSYYS